MNKPILAIHDTIRDTISIIIHDTIPKVEYITNNQKIGLWEYMGASTGDLIPALIGGILSGLVAVLAAYLTVKWTQKGDKKRIEYQVELEAKHNEALEKYRIRIESRQKRNELAYSLASDAINNCAHYAGIGNQTEREKYAIKAISSINELSLRGLITFNEEFRQQAINYFVEIDKCTTLEEKAILRDNLANRIAENLTAKLRDESTSK